MRGDVSPFCNPPTQADDAAFRDMVAVMEGKSSVQAIIDDAYAMIDPPPSIASAEAARAYETLNERMRSKVPWAFLSTPVPMSYQVVMRSEPGGGGVRVEPAPDPLAYPTKLDQARQRLAERKAVLDALPDLPLGENNELTLLKRKRDDDRARAKKAELFTAEPLSKTREQIAATWDVFSGGYRHL
jgi:hypothetical protein